MTDTVKNQGTAPAFSSITRYYLSLDSQKNNTDQFLVGLRGVSGLAPAAQASGTATVTVPSTTALGTYFLLACADDTGFLVERNVGNNCRASAIKVTVQP